MIEALSSISAVEAATTGNMAEGTLVNRELNTPPFENLASGTLEELSAKEIPFHDERPVDDSGDNPVWKQHSIETPTDLKNELPEKMERPGDTQDDSPVWEADSLSDNPEDNTMQEEPSETNERENSSDSEESKDVSQNKENDDVSESGNKELTEDEINEKQRAAIKDALERIRNGEQLSKEELGNLGEMMMDQYYISQGYTPLNEHRVTSLDDKKGGFRTGIDGVYEKTNPDGSKSYVIADAKYNTSQLSDTNDGKQMSDNWIDKRLDDAVGKEKADEIRDAAEENPDSVKHEVYHVDPNVDENGNTHADTQEVDSDGNKIGEKTIVEYFDEDGNRIEPSNEETAEVYK